MIRCQIGVLPRPHWPRNLGTTSCYSTSYQIPQMLLPPYSIDMVWMITPPIANGQTKSRSTRSVIEGWLCISIPPCELPARFKICLWWWLLQKIPCHQSQAPCPKCQDRERNSLLKRIVPKDLPSRRCIRNDSATLLAEFRITNHCSSLSRRDLCWGILTFVMRFSLGS